mmetsp:Transcript_154892/g.496319  ORF Transcript_154892/g.496319 Transcript_154892/m.496319 type:complete len:337 (+) Transcript_154892:143-1153(+)
MILLGVALEVLATVAGTIGKQLLRYSKLVEGTRHRAVSHLALSAGMVLNVLVGPVLEVAAYGQAPQTLLAPLCGLDVLWNILLVPYTLGEIPSGMQIAGCFLLVAGTALTAACGPHSEPPYTLDVMRERLLTDSALTYISIEVVLFIAGFLYIQRRPFGNRRRGLVLGCVAGGIGGNLFCMKAAASLISGSWSGGLPYVLHVWTEDPLPLLVTACAGLIGIVSAVLLARAMREFEATVMVATYEGAFVISGCASGIAVLGELDRLSPERRALYALGVFIVVGGVIAVQHGTLERALSPPVTPLPDGKYTNGHSSTLTPPTSSLVASVPLLKAVGGP